MSNIRHLFVSGQIQKVYRNFIKDNFEDTDFTWILGSLCLLGKLDEALTFSKKKKLESAHYFFLALSFIRRSDFLKAKDWIKKLQKNSHISEENTFFYYQSIAIYAYYRSRYKNCLFIVKKSRILSLNLSESFWKILAIDLLGHTHVQMGEVHKGIALLEEAHDLASFLGNKTFQQALKISILNYQSQYTSEPLRLISTIEKKLKTITQNDNYSEGSLTLSLAHLYLLTGEMEKAEKTLTNSQKIIFSASTPRHKCQWLFEKGFAHYLQDQYDLSLNYLNEAGKLVDPENEKKVSLKILGLKRQIFARLQKNTQELDQKLLTLTMQVGDPQAMNKLARVGLLPAQITEDPLQGMFDHYFKDNSHPEITDTGYYGVLRLQLEKDQSYFITGLWKNGLLILTPKTVLAQKFGVSSLLMSALIVLANKKSVSKEELVILIWGYDYDPLRHDTLLYALIHRLREILGPLEKGLIGENHHYSLNYSFKHLDLSNEVRPKNSSNENLQMSFKKTTNWNIRQHRALGLMKKGQTYKVSEYATSFNVSLMTALRDLKELHSFELINVYGKARATTYGI